MQGTQARPGYGYDPDMTSWLQGLMDGIKEGSLEPDNLLEPEAVAEWTTDILYVVYQAMQDVEC